MKTQLHLGKNPLPQDFVVNPIRPKEVFVKPIGGFWTSTYLPEGQHSCDWARWCDGETKWLEGEQYSIGTLLEVNEDAKVYTIDTLEDLSSLLRLGSKSLTGRIYYPDYEKLQHLFDGIHLTYEGQWATRMSTPSLYGWDSESTIWFKNVFHNIRPYTEKIVRDTPIITVDTE